MPNTNAKKGAYYKARSRKYLLAQGWQIADMEIVKYIFVPGRDRVPVKRDQFASDLVAMRGEEIVFVQVKGGEAARGGSFPAARRAFDAFQWPSTVKRWVMAWTPRAREPRIVEC